LPTARIKPLIVQGKKVHQVGLPWCFGWIMPKTNRGARCANRLTPNVGDANTMIPETKAFMVNITKLDAGKHPKFAL
jgi:formate dehydrogenase major subunit